MVKHTDYALVLDGMMLDAFPISNSLFDQKMKSSTAAHK
jgi:hypothetical protein